MFAMTVMMRVGPLATSAVGDVMDLMMIWMKLMPLSCFNARIVRNTFAIPVIYFVASALIREDAEKHFARTAEAPSLKYVRLKTLNALGQFCVIPVRYQDNVASIVRNFIAGE